MDSLYFIGKAQFHQLVTHISLHREESSSGYRNLADECLRQTGLKPERFTFWNVPLMSSYLGKAVPLDVHGGHVLIDEKNAATMAGSYGVLRYALLASAVRAKEGGRWRYDFTTMNLTLGIGVAAGFVTLSVGRQRLGWMRRHPIGCIGLSFIVCLATTVVCRQGIKLLGVGIVQAQNSHKKAMTALKCIDCLDDITVYTRGQIEELLHQQIPQQPGMPPPPPEFVNKYMKGIEMQCKLLETDISEVHLVKKRAGDALCRVHKGLREDPDGYVEPHGLQLLPVDRVRAGERTKDSTTEPVC